MNENAFPIAHDLVRMIESGDYGAPIGETMQDLISALGGARSVVPDCEGRPHRLIAYVTALLVLSQQR